MYTHKERMQELSPEPQSFGFVGKGIGRNVQTLPLRRETSDSRYIILSYMLYYMLYYDILYYNSLCYIICYISISSIIINVGKIPQRQDLSESAGKI